MQQILRIETVRPTRIRQEEAREEAGLVMEGISHAYGSTVVVNNITLTINAGEFLCLLGPSGCGKTTTLRIAAGLERPRTGQVWIGGKPVAGQGVFLPPEKRGVGFLFQDYALFPHLTVIDNVSFGIDHLPTSERRLRALEALERVGMVQYAQTYPHTLSGGQQQRVGLARALAPRPRLMLLDEPFSGLDKRLRDQVRDETLHVLKDSGVATLMVTHDPEEAMFMADVIALMRNGAIEQMGPPVELYCSPRTAFTARFFAEANTLDGVVQGGLITTPFGALEAEEGMTEGQAVEILIRPEALLLSAVADGDAPCYWATVLESRMLGRTSLIHLRVEQEGGAALHLHARVPGRYLPPPKEILAVTLDQSQTFVFPAPQKN